MPKVQLSNGPAFVSISHGFAEPTKTGYNWLGNRHVSTLRWLNDTDRQATRIAVDLPDNQKVEVMSVCNPMDKFTRKQGRELAAKKLAKALPDTLDIADKKRIFAIIFPLAKNS